MNKSHGGGRREDEKRKLAKKNKSYEGIKKRKRCDDQKQKDGR